MNAYQGELLRNSNNAWLHIFADMSVHVSVSSVFKIVVSSPD